jgi:pimeloyl-ACP methyl ester carboxylesterase
MVLVDAAPEDYVFSPEFLDAVRNGLLEKREDELMAQFGILRLRFLIRPGQFGIRNDLFPNARGELIAFYSSPKFVRATEDEGRSYSLVPPMMRGPGGFGRLGSLPLVVIQHGRPSGSIRVPLGMSQEQFERIWAESQRRLAGLSTNSVVMTAANSGHLINIDQPDLVIQATRRVVVAVRTDVSLDQVK